MKLLRAHVVMRHGDRTPVFNCWEPFANSAEESWAWARKLPSKNAVARLENCMRSSYDDGARAHSLTAARTKRGRVEESRGARDMGPTGPSRDAAMGVYGSLTAVV